MKEYTVKQLADELKTSKTTIQKIIKKLSLQPQRKRVNNQDIIVLSAEEAEVIKEDFKDRHPIPTTTENVSDNQGETTENNGANPQPTTENVSSNQKSLDQMLSMLQQQLEQKDDTIKYLQDELAKANEQMRKDNDIIAELAAKAQYITAADKTTQLIDMQQEKEAAAEPKEEKKQSFFKRVFGKK